MDPYPDLNPQPQSPPPMPSAAPAIPQRNIALYFILTFATCGIFGIYWFCTLNDDTNRISNHPEAFGGLAALLLTLVTCGIYSFFWLYAMGERIDEAKAARGLPAGSSGALYLILGILGLAFIAEMLLQSELNRLATA